MPGNVDRLAEILKIVRVSGALQATCNADEAQRAIDAAMQLPVKAHQLAMVQLASQLLTRRA